LKNFAGNFDKLNLKSMTLRLIVGLEDISGIFSMESIENLQIEHCNIRKIDGKRYDTRINRMILSECSGIENIDFLLSCENIFFLQLGGSSEMLLPTPKKWKIPNLNIYANGKKGRFYISKRDGKIVDSLNLKSYIK
jgi:hypothetical protein